MFLQRGRNHGKRIFNCQLFRTRVVVIQNSKHMLIFAHIVINYDKTFIEGKLFLLNIFFNQHDFLIFYRSIGRFLLI